MTANDQANGILKIARPKPGGNCGPVIMVHTWQCDVVDNGLRGAVYKTVGQFASLVINSAGLATIAYYNASDGDLLKVRATGGVRFVVAIDSDGNTTWSCVVSNGSSWSCSSDRNQKENLTAVDGREVLQRLSDVPIYKWNAKGADREFCASTYSNDQMEAMRTEDGVPAGVFMYGMISDQLKFPRGIANGAGESSGPVGVSCCGSGSWDFDGSYADWYAGHEIGHTLGRGHPARRRPSTTAA